MKKSTKGIIIAIAVIVPATIVAVALTSGKSEAPAIDHAAHGHTHGHNEGEESAASTEATATDESEVAVEIKDHAYTPATITVKVGTTVTWTNKDDVQHDVVATTPSADAPNSDLLSKGESYSFTFNKAGTYDYYCIPHPHMKGKVVVTE